MDDTFVDWLSESGLVRLNAPDSKNQATAIQMLDSNPLTVNWANELLKNTTVLVALIAGISVIISTAMLSAAIMVYGRSLERVAEIQRPTAISHFPTSFKVHFEGGHMPLRFDVNTKP